MADLCQTVASEIADPADREAFLAAVIPEAPARFGPGERLTARRNAAGSLVLGDGLRARRETALFAMPADLAQDLASPLAVLPPPA
jgi:hypothetical protein